MRRLLLCMGDMPDRASKLTVEKIEDFLAGLADFVGSRGDLLLLFGGRQGTLAERLLQKLSARLGSREVDQRVQTYIPSKFAEAELPEGDYVRHGVVVYIEGFPEQRREALVRDADAILLLGTGRGISEMAKIAIIKARFVIPIPIIDGPAVEAFARQMRRPRLDSNLHRLLSEIGGQGSTGRECAVAVGEILRLFLEGAVGKSQVFLAMPFIPEFEDRVGAEKTTREVCNRFGLTLYVAKDTLADRPLIIEILDQIEASALLIAHLDFSRANVYLEAGYAWGRGKPTILCAKDGTVPAFDVSAHEHVRWRTLAELRKGLGARVEKLVHERAIVSGMHSG